MGIYIIYFQIQNQCVTLQKPSAEDKAVSAFDTQEIIPSKIKRQNRSPLKWL